MGWGVRQEAGLEGLCCPLGELGFSIWNPYEKRGALPTKASLPGSWGSFPSLPRFPSCPQQGLRPWVSSLCLCVLGVLAAVRAGLRPGFICREMSYRSGAESLGRDGRRPGNPAVGQGQGPAPLCLGLTRGLLS